MDSVVGLTVWIKLKHPPNSVVYGVVKEVVAGSHMSLQNVLFPDSPTRWEHWTVQTTAIVDLQVIEPSAVPTPDSQQYQQQQQQYFQQQQQQQAYNRQFSSPAHQPPLPQHQHHPPPPQPYPQPPPPHVSRIAELPATRHASAPVQPSPVSVPAAGTPQRQASAFVDPAIVSYGTSSPSRQRSASRSAEFETPIKSMLQRAAANLPSPSSPFIGDLRESKMAKKLAASKPTPPPSQPPPPPLASKPVLVPAPTAEQDLALQENGTKKKVRRGQKPKKPTPAPLEVHDAVPVHDPPPVMNAEVSRNGNDMNGAVKRGKGWRSTPLLQPSPQTISPLDRANVKKSRRKQKEEQEQEFAQGDTTDIPDMGDFDFDANLKKFDKKQVFDEIRAGDTTADEDRLVSHNRIHRPGTYGGKNLHPTESVLSPPLEPKYNSNEVDSSSDADTELHLANGRSSSKHSVSRTVFPKTKPSRQNSGQIESRPQPHPLTASMSSDRARNRSTTSLATRNKQASSLAASSPRPDGRNSPLSALSVLKTPMQGAVKHQESHFAIRPHGTSCPTLLPRALDNLEAATVTMYGISHDTIAESAARCIAETALQLSDMHGGIRRPSRTNTLRGSMTASTTLNSPSESSTVVVLAGNHAIGARALAAARHLLGRNYKVIAAESLFETADTQDLQVKQQTSILRKMSRGGANIKRGIWAKSFRHIKNLDGPPCVIIDALLAGATYESLLASNAEFSTNVQKETREMIEWANRSRAPVLSVGCPSGFSGIDGQSTIVEGEPLAVRPDQVLALGAPMQGLLKATEKWPVRVADIGINISLVSDEALAFGGTWLVDLEHVDDEATPVQ